MATSESVSVRTDRLLPALAELGVDLLLVTDLTALRYLTGFTGSSGLALAGPDLRRFGSDFRYVEQVAAEVDPAYEFVQVSQNLSDAVAALLPPGPCRLGFDDGTMAVQTYSALRGMLGADVEFVPAAGLIEELRRTKEPVEVAAIAAASEIADAAFEALVAGGLAGHTERELALALEHELRLRGADGSSFSPIIAAGPHGARPHATPRDVAVESGQLVVIDWGAVKGGYCSDCTRTVAVGEVSAEAREIYELVLQAQLAGLDAVVAGADCHAADAVVRDIINAAGHADHYGHGLGHGVGLEVHEAPTLSFRIKPGADALRAGDAVTVEPGIYLPGKFGVRIEDLVIVTDGAPTIITAIPKALRVVD
jgi:Xaa-Pro aminopeptidase